MNDNANDIPLIIF